MKNRYIQSLILLSILFLMSCEESKQTNMSNHCGIIYNSKRLQAV